MGYQHPSACLLQRQLESPQNTGLPFSNELDVFRHGITAVLQAFLESVENGVIQRHTFKTGSCKTIRRRRLFTDLEMAPVHLHPTHWTFGMSVSVKDVSVKDPQLNAS